MDIQGHDPPITRVKLCYILPEYYTNTDTHFYHIYELLDEISRVVDIFLIIERSKEFPQIKNLRKMYAQKFTFIPLRFVELLFLFMYARLIGYKKFYVHYTYAGGILASSVTKIFGGETYYWHCGGKKEYMTKWEANIETIKMKITDDCLFLLTLKLMDYLVTGTLSLADYYSRNFGVNREKIKILPNWINIDRFDPKKYKKGKLRRKLGIDEKKKVILFIHRLSERKGAHHIARIANDITIDSSDTLFIVIGDGPYRDKLGCEIKKNRLNKYVKILGSAPNRDIAKYYAVADVFIMPSDEAGFPRVLLECMTMNVPFVATDVGGVKDIVPRNGKYHIVPRGNIEMFVKRVLDLLVDESPCNLREFIKEKYRKELVANKFIEIIAE